MADPTRIMLIYTLVEGEKSVCELAEERKLSQHNVSRHLKVLREAGLVRGEIEGPATCYCLDPEGFRWLKEQIGSWLPETIQVCEPLSKL